VSEPLPLFPLHTVLTTDGLLPLKIFEARYLDLMSRCLREGSPFGVVALKSGVEAGRQAEGTAVQMHDTGTLAHVLDVDAPTAGILHVRCRGGAQFTLGARWQESDGLWIGEATVLEPEPDAAPAAAHANLVRSLREAVAALERENASPFLAPHRFESAAWVADRWLDVLPLGTEAKQMLLEQRDPAKRIAIVDSLMQARAARPPEAP
jgi:Lon protease-like protein